MSALISDIIDGSIKPMTSNAAVNAAGKLLKVVDMQMRYGSKDANLNKDLVLVKDQTEPARIQ